MGSVGRSAGATAFLSSFHRGYVQKFAARSAPLRNHRLNSRRQKTKLSRVDNSPAIHYPTITRTALSVHHILIYSPLSLRFGSPSNIKRPGGGDNNRVGGVGRSLVCRLPRGGAAAVRGCDVDVGRAALPFPSPSLHLRLHGDRSGE